MIEVQLTLFEGYIEGVCHCCHKFGHVDDMIMYDVIGLWETVLMCDDCMRGKATIS